MENPIKMDDLGVSLFLETPILLMRINHQSSILALPDQPIHTVKAKDFRHHLKLGDEKLNKMKVVYSATV